MEGQQRLQQARVNYANLKGYGVSSEFTQSLNNYLGQEMVAGRLSDSNYSKIMSGVGSLAEAGYTDAQMRKKINSQLFSVNNDGTIKVGDNLDESLKSVETDKNKRLTNNEELRNAQKQTENQFALLNEVIKEVVTSLQSNIANIKEEAMMREALVNSQKNGTTVNDELAKIKTREAEASAQATNKDIEEGAGSEFAKQKDIEEGAGSEFAKQKDIEEGAGSEFAKQKDIEEGMGYGSFVTGN
jgi:hypothetical protein